MPTEFQNKVYEIIKRVPKGRVTTYKIVAEMLKTRGYRAVGNALNKNPYSPIVPCHRVVNYKGQLHGFAVGLKKKEEMLKKEGVKVKKGRIADFESRLYRF